MIKYATFSIVLLCNGADHLDLKDRIDCLAISLGNTEMHIPISIFDQNF